MICTTIEQSKKLIELGIDITTADMYYYTVNGDLYKIPNIIESKDDLYVDEKSIPTWSLSALLKLIPNFNMFKRTIECKIETTNHLVDKVCEPLDAAFEMIVWLKENKKI